MSGRVILPFYSHSAVRLCHSAGVQMDFLEDWGVFIGWLDGQRQEDPRAWFRSMVMHDKYRTSYWVIRQLNLWVEEMGMRGKSKTTAKKQVAGANWTTFVEVSLAGHTMEDIVDKFGDPDVLADAVQALVERGYRLSFSYSPQNDSMIASLTCKAEGDPNEGCTMTSFAMDWVTATRIACYKHFVVTGEKWAGSEAAADRPRFG